MQCKRCKAIFVCSRACLRKAWPAYMEECAGKFVFVYAPDAERDTIFELIGETREGEQEVLRQQKIAKDLRKRCHGRWMLGKERHYEVRCLPCCVLLLYGVQRQGSSQTPASVQKG